MTSGAVSADAVSSLTFDHRSNWHIERTVDGDRRSKTTTPADESVEVTVAWRGFGHDVSYQGA